jgi:hypothetical protein
MSGATLSGVVATGRQQFADYVEPRRPFGRRVAPRPVGRDGAFGYMPAHSVDVAVADLRRRIATPETGLHAPLSWMACGLAMAGVSLLLWAGAFELGVALVHRLVSLF